MTPFNIYLWGIVDPLRAGILAINIVLFSAAAFSAFTGFVEEDESFVSRRNSPFRPRGQNNPKPETPCSNVS